MADSIIISEVTIDYGALQAFISSDPGLHHAVVFIAEEIVAEAQTLVPVATGALRESIRVEEDGHQVSVVAGDEQVDYASYVEFGTYKMAAQPYMRPAIGIVAARTY